LYWYELIINTINFSWCNCCRL